MKKIIAFILIASILGVPVMAGAKFTDLSESHWAYSAVNKLVNDGTVKGYTDGTFKPTNAVTRAEFVKMMGEGPERREKDYADVSKDHWAYDCIMTSGFEADGNEFLPGQVITRGETIKLLWKRQGSVKGLFAPNAVTNQLPDAKDAVAWAYNNRVMLGDDGLNLRLNDGLSRAEAAALIVRTRETDYSQPQANFKDAVWESTLKQAFESFRLFDDETAYVSDKTITNGEMAKAAMRLALNEYNLLYGNYDLEPAFSHPYAKDLTIIANRVLGIRADEDFANKPATIEDTVAAFSFAAIENSVAPLGLNEDGKNYKDISADKYGAKYSYLSFAFENGVSLNADGTLGAGRNATHKDIAALLIQFDNISGFNKLYSTKKEDDSFVKYDAKLRYDFNNYPKNKDDFVCVLSGTENINYEKPVEIKAQAKTMDEMYDFSREYNSLLITHINQLIVHLKNSYGVDAEFIIYPNLTWDNGERFVLRMKCKINGVSSSDISVDTIFSGTLVTPVSGNLKAGMEFFVEIQTGTYLSVLLGM